jgi:hypothetical protein
LTLAIHMQLEALNEGKLPQFCKWGKGLWWIKPLRYPKESKAKKC